MFSELLEGKHRVQTVKDNVQIKWKYTLQMDGVFYLHAAGESSAWLISECCVSSTTF